MSTSPVPAVASDGGPSVADDDRSTRRGDDRVRALEEHRRPEPLRRGPGCLQAVRVDPGGVGVEQARQLACVRSEDRRGVALDGLEAEQRVGVDDGREIDPRQQLANERASGIRAPEAGPDRERRRPLAASVSTATASSSDHGELHGLQSEHLRGRERLLGTANVT